MNDQGLHREIRTVAKAMGSGHYLKDVRCQDLAKSVVS